MVFLNSLALWLLLLFPLPFLAHLLHHRRRQLQSWSAMFFLRKIEQARAGRMRIQNALLLLLRGFAILLLLLAPSRPAIHAQRSQLPADTPATSLILMDTSASMQMQANGKTLFESMKEDVIEYIVTRPAGEEFLLMSAAKKPISIIPYPTHDRDRVIREVRQLQPGWQNLDMPRGMQESLFLLENGRCGRRRVVFFTDAAEAGWRSQENEPWRRLRSHADGMNPQPFFHIRVTPPILKEANAAVLNLQATEPIQLTGVASEFRADIRGTDDVYSSRAEWWVDDRLVAERDVELRGELVSLHFEHRFETPGFHTVELRLNDDSQEIDNRRVCAIHVRSRIPLLLVGRSLEEQELANASGWLHLALSDKEYSPFDLTEVDGAALEGMDSGDLEPYRSVILANIPTLSGHDRYLLERYVKEGGGLWVILHRDADQASYAGLFEGQAPLLPAAFDHLVEMKNSLVPLTLQLGGKSEAAVVIRDVEFHWLWQLTPGLGSEILAWTEEFPLMVLGASGRGACALSAFSPELGCTNLPITPHFLPWVHKLLLRLNSSGEQSINLECGETYRLNRNQEEEMQIRKPNGEVSKLSFSDSSLRVLDENLLASPGIYSVESKERSWVLGMQVNSAEWNLQEVSFNENLKFKLSRTATEFNHHMEMEGGVLELWRLCLVAALALLLFEAWLSGRLIS